MGDASNLKGALSVNLTRFFAIAIAAAVAATSVVAPSEVLAGPPTDVVKTKQGELFKLLESKDSESAKKISAIFDEMLDYDGLAKASLGDEWSTLKEAEQKEFSGLLKQLVQQAYERNLRKTLAFNIEYLSEEKVSDTAFVVKTKASHKTDSRQEPLEINFRMVDKGGGKWRIDDIITEDVSLVSSYRSQFVKILKKDGYAALAKKMKEKIAKGS
jgi:phospholipid transport system substrate-binding protein